MTDKSIENIEDIYPMSDVSKGMIYHSLKDESAGVFYNQIVYYIKDKDFTAPLLEKTLDLIIRKHAMLRTGFKIADIEEPLQIVYKNYKPNFQHVDISHMTKQEQEEYIKKTLQEDRRESFDINSLEPLWRVKTFQLDEENICFLWIGHHAIMDGWSSALLMTEMHTFYVQLKSEPAFVPGPMKSTYKDFVIEQLVQKKQPAVTEFWQKELEGYKQFPFWETASASEEGEGEEEKKGFYLKLDAEILNKLHDTAINYNTSIRNVCFAAYAYMLNMNSYDDDIIAGFIMNNRPVCEDGDKIIGCFLNTVPVRVKIPAGLSWKDYLILVDSKIIQLSKYNRLSLFEIIERTGYKGRDDNPLVNTVFNYTDFFVLKELGQDILDLNSRTESEGALNVRSSGDSNTMFDFSVGNTFGKFEINISYSSRINDNWVEHSVGYFTTILDKFISTPGNIIKKDDLIPLAEKQKLLYEFNNTQMEYPGDKTIHQLFAQRVEQQPDNMALVDQVGHLTYRELNEKANHLAQILKEKGVEPGDIIGIKIKCSLELVIGILGILKADGVYLPIDPESPGERIDFMLKDSNAKIVIINKSESPRRGHPIKNINDQTTNDPNKTVEDLMVLDFEFRISNLSSLDGCPRRGLAYVIYTSGSTGRPKGVVIKHRSFVNLIYYHRSVFSENRDSRMSQVANPAFDAMGFEIWPCLTSGASLHITDNDIRLSPANMRDWLIKQGITISFQPTVIAEYLLDEKWTAEGVNLKTVCAAGDKLSRRPKQSYPFKLYNLYGPTEDTVWTTWTLVEMTMTAGPGKLPGIGKPIANHKVYILNKNLNLQPVGVPGEMCISGDGLAEGYLNNPELTRRTFEKVPLDPPKLLFNNHSPLTTHHSPIYHTGDFARWLDDGSIEFLGRIDYQVKIRGYRIETGEIENQLRHCEQIQEAAVIAWENPAGDKYLCAYIVPRGELKIPELREHLRQNLPDYMIPAQFIPIERIPLTANGKLDRRALPDPEPLAAVNYTAPRDAVERKLTEIWSEILEMPKEIISIDSDFFQLGGHSMKAIRLVALANRENFNVSFAEVIKYNTIAGLAEHIKAKKQENGNSTVLPGGPGAAENMSGKNPGFQPDIYSEYFPCILGSLREKFKYEHGYEICKGVLLAADGKTLMALGAEKNSGIKEKLALLGYPYSELCGFKSISEIFGYTMELTVFSSLEEEIAYCRETINQKKLALLTGTTYFLNYTPDYLLDRVEWLKKMDEIFQGYNESQKGKFIGHTFMLADIISDYYIVYDSTYNYYGRVPAANFHKAIQGNSAIECSRGHVSFEAYLPYKVFQVDSDNLNRPDMKEMIWETLKRLVELTVTPKVLQREINGKEYYAYFGLEAIKEFARVIEQGIENEGEYEDLFVYADNIANSWKYKHIYLRDFLLDFRNFFPIHSDALTGIGKVINSWHTLLEKIQKKKNERNGIPGFLKECVKEIGNIYTGHEDLFEKLKEAVK